MRRSGAVRAVGRGRHGAARTTLSRGFGRGGRTSPGPGAGPRSARGGGLGRRVAEPGRARRNADHADGPPERHPHDDGLRLRAPRRLQPRPRAGHGHRRAHRGGGPEILHLLPAQEPQVVRRPSLHRRGFPLLLRGRRQRPGPLALRAAQGPAGRWRGAALRGHRRAHDPIQLVEPQSLLPARHSRRAAAVDLSPGALLEAVSRPLRGR